jgi:hypothetical protein
MQDFDDDDDKIDVSIEGIHSRIENQLATEILAIVYNRTPAVALSTVACVLGYLIQKATYTPEEEETLGLDFARYIVQITTPKEPSSARH